MEFDYHCDVSHLDPTDGVNEDQVRLMIAAWMGLLADSPLRLTHGHKPLRTLACFYKEIRQDLFGVSLRYAQLAHEIVSSTVVGVNGTSTGTYLPAMRDTPVFKEYLKWHRDLDVECLKYVYTFLVFTKKAEISDEALHANALRDWYATEERLSGLQLPDWVGELLPIVEQLVPTRSQLRDSIHRPKFGPGRVAERGISNVSEKADAVSYSHLVDRAFYGIGSEIFGLTRENGYHVDKVIPDPEAWYKARSVGTIDRIPSLMKMVVKDRRKSRSICMEPNTFMFHQQSLMRLFVDAFETNAAGRYIKLEDQEISKNYSRYASASNFADTLDLSSASDSVHVDLVRRIFPRHVLYFMLATRSRHAKLPDGMTVELKKFAPMGSAMCFPTQCVIFLAIIIRSAMVLTEERRQGGRSGMDLILHYVRRGIHSLFRDVSPRGGGSFLPPAVYGDDLIIDRALTGHVIQSLKSLGFVVNEGKSFIGECAFRESCGGYYMGGEDISPLFYSVKNLSRKDPKWLASVIDQVNRSGDHRRFNLARVLRCVLREERRDILYSDDREVSCAIYTHTPRNDHLLKRWNSNYQRMEVGSIGIFARKTDPVQNDRLERYLYVQYWNSIPMRASTSPPSDFRKGDSMSSRRMPGDALARRRWTPVW